VCSGQHNPWLFLVAVVFAAGTQATVPGWLIGTVVGQHGDSLRLDERDSHAMLAEPPAPLRTSSRMVPTGAARRPALGLSLQF